MIRTSHFNNAKTLKLNDTGTGLLNDILNTSDRQKHSVSQVKRRIAASYGLSGNEVERFVRKNVSFDGWKHQENDE